MQRVILERLGAPAEVVRVEELAEPGAPELNEALVEMVASPIHPADLLTIMGMYASETRLPKTLGKEGVGRVVAVGDHVKHLKAGDLTPVLMPNDGVWQHRYRLNAEHLVALPAGGDPLQYAMAIGNPATALLMLRTIVKLELGDWVLQNAANSAVGQYLIQLAKREGLRTVNVVRREGLASRLHDLGADVVLVDGLDLPQRVAKATGGTGIKLALDAVSGDSSARLSACLAQGGTLCNYGMMSGKSVQVSPAALIGNDISVRGFWVSSAMARMSKEERAKLYGELIPLVVSGALQVRVEATYPLSRVHEALAHASKGERNGKILLIP
ncbi:MAG: zinc-dependent alcohol dehydrogenase family protein [Bryobacterales bacterium]|nr:zinc-dependent alcohol dehydrogenase family protein [Bryobacterales bacterium]